MGKIILITGISGQDGSYLAEYLLSKNYIVHGVIRRSSSFNTKRIDHIFDKLHLHYGDLSDASNITNLIREIKPDEIYHMAAMSHVRVSFDEPVYTTDIGVLGTLRLLEAVRKFNTDIKIYHAASSEMYGDSPPPQKETTPFRPRSPYGVAKLASHWNCVNYRNGYGMFICNGVLFNHSSPRRGETFISKKITKGIANIIAGKQSKILVGNLDAKRDWGFAPDYVEIMHTILQQNKPNDFVIGTGESHSVKEFITEAFKYVGMPIRWEGTALNTKGILPKNRIVIETDFRYCRPTEVEFLQADPHKANIMLNWTHRVNFKELIMIMIDYDLMKLGLPPIGEGLNLIKKKKFDWSIIH